MIFINKNICKVFVQNDTANLQFDFLIGFLTYQLDVICTCCVFINNAYF